jgi:serine/threonine protein kinase/Tol biopolymer transport system component
MKCPKCQTENTLDSEFCKKCAAPLTSSREIGISRTETLVPPREDLTTGAIFAGRYQVIEELGHGGMGKVYKVFDKETKSRVALKLISPDVAGHKNAIERFRNELKIARDISHKNICRMYDLGREAETYYITMEYVPGEDLRSLIRRTRRLDMSTAISIAKQVCEGLIEAHRLGVVHRDLKPSNIMIDREGNAKVMDFGIARSLKGKGMTATGAMIGTPEYMSPEQVDGKEADQRADIYSLGIILYEMVTGKVPFGGDTAFAVALKHKSEPPESPKKLNPQIPENLSRLILKCLEKDKENRYQIAGEVLAELTKVEQGLPAKENIVPKRKAIPIREITVHFSLRKLLIPGLALAATATLVILFIFFINRKASEPPLAASHKQLTFAGNASCPAIAPDGKFFAYATYETFDEQAIFVQDIVSGQSLELLRAKNCRYLGWKPDSSEISFWARMKDSSSGIFIIPRLGGTPRRLVTAELFAWSPDGSQFASCNADSREIRITDPTTGESTTIPLKSPLGRLVEIDWSAKSNYLLSHTQYESHRYEIWTTSFDGREQNKVLEGDLHSPRWSPGESAIYCIRYKPPALYEILKIPISPKTGRPTKHPSIILSQPQRTEYFTITSDGKKLLYAPQQNYSNLWLATVAKSGKEQSVDIKQLTKGTFYDMCPSISPDGQNVVFSRGFGDIFNVYVMPLENGIPQQISFMDSLNFFPVWSPDGKEIVFSSNQAAAYRMWKVSAHGGNPYQFKKSKLADVSGKIAWAPGKNIMSLGTQGAVILDPDTGEETPLLKENSDLKISDGRYSPDGKKVAVLGSRPPDYDGLWVISLEDSSQVFLRKGALFPIEWSSDGKWIYVSESILGTIKIIAVAPESKEAKTLFNLPFTLEKGQPYNFQVTMTSDAKRFVFPSLKTQSDVWAVENFDQTIK